MFKTFSVSLFFERERGKILSFNTHLVGLYLERIGFYLVRRQGDDFKVTKITKTRTCTKTLKLNDDYWKINLHRTYSMH